MRSLYADLLFPVEKQKKKILTELLVEGTDFCLCLEQFYQLHEECRFVFSMRELCDLLQSTSLNGFVGGIPIRDPAARLSEQISKAMLLSTERAGSNLGAGKNRVRHSRAPFRYEEVILREGLSVKKFCLFAVENNLLYSGSLFRVQLYVAEFLQCIGILVPYVLRSIRCSSLQRVYMCVDANCCPSVSFFFFCV